MQETRSFALSCDLHVRCHVAMNMSCTVIRYTWDMHLGCEYPSGVSIWDMDVYLGWGYPSWIFIWNVHLRCGFSSGIAQMTSMSQADFPEECQHPRCTSSPLMEFALRQICEMFATCITQETIPASRMWSVERSRLQYLTEVVQ